MLAKSWLALHEEHFKPSISVVSCISERSEMSAYAGNKSFEKNTFRAVKPPPSYQGDKSRCPHWQNIHASQSRTLKPQIPK